MDELQQYVGIAPAWFAVAPLIGAALLVGCCYLVVRRHVTDSWKVVGREVSWSVPALLVLLLLALVCLFGLYVSNEDYLVGATALVTVSGCVPLFRGSLDVALERLPKWAEVVLGFVRDVIIICASIFLSFVVLELPWNPDFLSIEPKFILVNLVLVGTPIMAVYLIGGRRGAPLAVLPAAFCILGIAQYFLCIFKSSAIRPSDVFALQTALSVSGGFSYELGGHQILALGICSATIAMLSFVRPQHLFAKRGSGLRLAVSGACAACGVGVFVAAGLVLGSVSLSDDLGFTPISWNSVATYRSQGFAASFVTLVQHARIASPDGYTESGAEDLLQEYVARYQQEAQATSAREEAERQFQETRPTVVAIMNEAFSDLSIYEELHSGYEGPSRLKSMEDALYTGYVYSSVLGGSTCNSEFEFLVGATMGFVGAENQPYVMNGFSNTPSLARQLGEMGYLTSAVHPQPSSNWNRAAVYDEMGFDRFLDINSFDSSAPVRHAGLTDAVTYEKVLELIESDDGPQFIFDVTMQNHGAYDTFDLPEEERVDPGIDWVEGPLITETTEYVSLIEASDRELSDFINRLRELDRPVVVVFFGDHQPIQGDTFNNLIYSEEEEDDPAHYARVYQTPYLIWANYDVAGNDQVSERLDMGINSLAAVMLDSIGAPMTDWQMEQVALLQEVPVINGYAYQTPDGRWHELGGDVADAVRDIEWIQYLEYASKL